MVLPYDRMYIEFSSPYHSIYFQLLSRITDPVYNNIAYIYMRTIVVWTTIFKNFTIIFLPILNKLR